MESSVAAGLMSDLISNLISGVNIGSVTKLETKWNLGVRPVQGVQSCATKYTFLIGAIFTELFDVTIVVIVVKDF